MHQITNIGFKGFASLGKKIDDSLLTASRGGVITNMWLTLRSVNNYDTNNNNKKTQCFWLKIVVTLKKLIFDWARLRLLILIKDESILTLAFSERRVVAR